MCLFGSYRFNYSSTKAALHSLSRGIAQLSKGSNVTSNVVVHRSTLSEGAKTVRN